MLSAYLMLLCLLSRWLSCRLCSLRWWRTCRIKCHRFCFDLLLKHWDRCQQIAGRGYGHTPDPPMRWKTNFEAVSRTSSAIEFESLLQIASSRQFNFKSIKSFLFLLIYLSRFTNKFTYTHTHKKQIKKVSIFDQFIFLLISILIFMYFLCFVKNTFCRRSEMRWKNSSD